MKKYLYLIKNAKIPTYLKYWLMYSSKKISLLIQSLPITLENTIKDLKITINKIYGNIEQATRSGKNLLNTLIKRQAGTTLSSHGINATFNSDGTITLNGTNDGTANSAFYIYNDGAVLTLESGTYYTLRNDKNVEIIGYYGGYQDFVANDSFNLSDTRQYTYVYVQIPSTNTNTFSNYILKPYIGKSSVTTDTWEQYGASPSPDYPSPVSTITGDVEITISNEDNTQEQNYSISLGDIELCKIGDYQDYIYKENGNWYKYGAIGKVILNGSESWGRASNGAYYLSVPTWNYLRKPKMICKSNYFVGFINQQGTTYVPDNTIAFFDGTTSSIICEFYCAYREKATLEDFKTWLSTHNTEVYYVLETPVITEITDTTLINQLNALEQAYSYEDVTNISSNQNIYLDIDYIKRG